MSAIPAMPMFPHSGAALIASANPTLREQVAHRLNGRCRPVQQALGGADALTVKYLGELEVVTAPAKAPVLIVTGPLSTQNWPSLPQPKLPVSPTPA